MTIINNKDKKRIIDFILTSDLDYQVSDGEVLRFHLVSEDRKLFYFYTIEGKYLLYKVDPESAIKPDNISAHQYFKYDNLQQVMEQLAYYDNSLYKSYWSILDGHGMPSENIQFFKEKYDEKWFKDYFRRENWRIESEDNYKYLVYEEKRKCKVISPHNELHLYSPINEYSPFEMDRLYFEIHPISCENRNESYYIKILINNEEIMKEYIKYMVVKKKGLKIFLEELMNNKNIYVKL
jgi:hypothetical protein